MRILLLIGVLSNALHTYAQLDLKKKVSVDFENTRIEDVLAWMQQHQVIKVSYGFDNVQHEIRISLHAKNSSVLEILREICKQGGLIFLIIDNTVVFKYLSQVPVQPKRMQIAKRRSVLDSQSPSDSSMTTSTIQDNTSRNYSSSDTLSDNNIIVKSEIVHEESNTANYSSKTLQKKLNIQGGLLISYALDFNRFNFNQRDITTQQFTSEQNASYCLGGYIVLSRKFSASLGIMYVTKDFHLNYNYKVLDLNDPFPIPNKTSIELHYIELPLWLAYKIAAWKNVSLRGSFGLYPAFLSREQETTTYKNSGDSNTSYFSRDNQASICSSSLSIVLSYQFNKHSGFFIEPGYSLMFRPVNDQAMRSNSSLLRFKTGIQYSLSSHK